MVTFTDFVKENLNKENKKGVYIGLSLDAQSKNSLSNLIQKLNIPNTVLADNLHTTIAYSTKYFKSDLEDIKSENINFPAKVKGYDLFNNEKNRTACLVLILDCPDAISYHNKTIQQGAIYDYAEYNPHITIVNQCTIGTTIDIAPFLELSLTFNSIYQEDLDTNWGE